MRSDDQQQRRLAAAPADAAYLGAPVQQQAHAAGGGVLHCSGVISSPVGASQVDSLRSSSSFHCAVRKWLWRSTA